MPARKFLIGLSVATVIVAVGAVAVGDYVYREGTSLSCSISDDQRGNSLAEFYPAGVDNGPFPGDGWNVWVDYDLSDYWLTDTAVVDVTIPVADGVVLHGWWVEAVNAQGTVIVTHGYGASRRDFNTLLPTSMLIREGVNVLLVDQRNSGESSCTTGRHTAGQVESDDFAQVARFAMENGYAEPGKLGMFGVSGGGIATSILPAKTTDVSAFAIESAIFDFADTATREVEYQGFPGFLWRLADVASRLRGENLQAVPIAKAVEALDGRPMMILHGTIDQRLAFEEAVKLASFGATAGQTVVLEPFVGSDHTEGMLREPERYQQLLGDFFRGALMD